jgi:hypothetical protein
MDYTFLDGIEVFETYNTQHGVQLGALPSEFSKSLVEAQERNYQNEVRWQIDFAVANVSSLKSEIMGVSGSSLLGSTSHCSMTGKKMRMRTMKMSR